MKIPPFSLQETMSDQRHYLTILGLGNILLQDEGFGVHFIRWFESATGCLTLSELSTAAHSVSACLISLQAVKILLLLMP